MPATVHNLDVLRLARINSARAFAVTSKAGSAPGSAAIGYTLTYAKPERPDEIGGPPQLLTSEQLKRIRPVLTRNGYTLVRTCEHYDAAADYFTPAESFAAFLRGFD